MAVRIVAHAFEIIHLLTDQNPIQVRLEFSRRRRKTMLTTESLAPLLLGPGRCHR